MTQPIEKHVALWLGLSNKKALEKTEGLVKALSAGKLSIFRLTEIPGLPEHVRQITPPLWASKSRLVGHIWIAFASLWHAMKRKPEICMCISLYPHALIAQVVALLSRSKFGIWFIGSDQYHHIQHPLAQRLLVPILRRANIVMCMGESSRKHLIDQGFSQSHIAIGKNAYRLESYMPSEISNTKWDVIFTGRLDLNSKHLALFIDTISITVKKLPDLRVVMVGEGPGRHWLNTTIENLALNKNFLLVGHSNEIPYFLQASKVCLMTSRWEGLPASIVEAFACGLPVVSTDVGDISTICRHGHNGLLAKSQSGSELSSLLHSALTDPGLYARLRLGALETGQMLRLNSIDASARAWRNAMSTIVSRPSYSRDHV